MSWSREEFPTEGGTAVTPAEFEMRRDAGETHVESLRYQLADQPVWHRSRCWNSLPCHQRG